MRTPRPHDHGRDIDPTTLKITLQLSSAQRVKRLLDARQLIMGLRLGQLQQQYPTLSRRELILKMIDSFNEPE